MPFLRFSGAFLSHHGNMDIEEKRAEAKRKKSRSSSEAPVPGQPEDRPAHRSHQQAEDAEQGEDDERLILHKT